MTTNTTNQSTPLYLKLTLLAGVAAVVGIASLGIYHYREEQKARAILVPRILTGLAARDGREGISKEETGYLAQRLLELQPYVGNLSDEFIELGRQQGLHLDRNTYKNRMVVDSVETILRSGDIKYDVLETLEEELAQDNK